MNFWDPNGNSKVPPMAPPCQVGTERGAVVVDGLGRSFLALASNVQIVVVFLFLPRRVCSWMETKQRLSKVEGKDKESLWIGCCVGGEMHGKEVALGLMSLC